MNVLDLFSGIGGFSLGLERAGMRTVAFCEINEYCRRILKKHWPNIPCYDDVRTLTADRLRADGIIPDFICGGFPCQDISVAGAGAGLEGARSGLWIEYARLIEEIRPKGVLIENVAALRGRGLGTVLGFLASLGYDAEWHCIPASAVGAPHQRDRIWIFSYPNDDEWRRLKQERRSQGRNTDVAGYGPQGALANTPWNGNGRARQRTEPSGACGRRVVTVEAISKEGADVADALGVGSGARLRDQGSSEQRRDQLGDRGGNVSLSCSAGLEGRDDAEGSRPPTSPIITRSALDGIRAAAGQDQWISEPNVGRVADGVSNRVDRLTALGNAVVPQIPELIGRAIMSLQK